MTQENPDVQQLKEMISQVCGDSAVAEPAKFLAALMAGKDPRARDSKLFRLVKQIRDEDRSPDDDEWSSIKKMVLYTDLYRPAPVSLDESAKAARQLMEYLHAKLKSVSIRGKIAHKHVVIKDLTPEEVETFEDWFTSHF